MKLTWKRLGLTTNEEWTVNVALHGDVVMGVVLGHGRMYDWFVVAKPEFESDGISHTLRLAKHAVRIRV